MVREKPSSLLRSRRTVTSLLSLPSRVFPRSIRTSDKHDEEASFRDTAGTLPEWAESENGEPAAFPGGHENVCVLGLP